MPVESKNEEKNREPNHLINEKSPYLLQHAYNPIDWYPWSDAAFEKAKSEDKPIFLSIGYSSCHWCHVMEAESFEDEAVAELMNEHFVAIKVDREERPDIDSIYMTVCQAFTGSGGWPLTIIMTPDKKPFFAGTYFPKQAKYGRPGLQEVLNQIIAVWGGDREKLIESSEQITDALQQLSAYAPGEMPDVENLRNAYKHFLQSFDGTYGGFGTAPKFPSPHNLLFLLRWWDRTGEEDALVMVERTLRMMHRGGIFDHLGKGFHRYSTDPVWLIPHFEKMLYDQALIANAYIEAHQATADGFYGDVAKQIFEYVLRDMTSPEGGFYSAEDADSEGAEGKFYAWTVDEIKSILDADDVELIIKYYGLTEKGNFEPGTNALYIAKDMKMIASESGEDIETLPDRIRELSKQLYTERGKRIPPFKDDKILTDWNGLMIAALAKGASALDDMSYADAAKRAADFLIDTMKDNNGRLLHRYRDGEAAIMGYADDYAFLTWGLIELYEVTFDVKYMAEAIRLTDEMLELFWDENHGGLYFTGSDAEALISRTKEIYDGAVPSGNSIAALNLLRLGRITANADYEDKALEIIKLFGETASKSPMGFAQFFAAVDFMVGPSKEIVIAGNPDDPVTKQMLGIIRTKFIPNKIVILRLDGENEIDELVPYAKDMKMIDGKTTAYVCENFACKAPTNDVGELLKYLDG